MTQILFVGQRVRRNSEAYCAGFALAADYASLIRPTALQHVGRVQSLSRQGSVGDGL